ncbi:hypothetical protein I4U23_014055 [Adineta vaga]|nr:hypothetical protein I4U23_014055 [Adineta vaga]
MCERSRLFLLEAKSILSELLNRTLELFDLCLRVLEHYRLTEFLIEREQQRDYRYFSLQKPCRLNYNIMSDLNTYLQRLYTTCRLTKSNLRSLHAARITSTDGYIVIDDEIYELVKLFKSKLNNIQSEKLEQEKPIKTNERRYYSQRLIHSSRTTQPFTFHSKTSKQKNNSQNSFPHSSEHEESYQILQSFQKISRFYHFLLKQFYGVHSVQDSDVLQPIVISIIRLLLFITNKLKENLQIISPIKIHHNRFSVQQHDDVCQEQKTSDSNKPKYHIIEIQADNIESIKSVQDNTAINYAQNDNFETIEEKDEKSILEFDEDEFYRLANLQRDD